MFFSALLRLRLNTLYSLNDDNLTFIDINEKFDKRYLISLFSEKECENLEIEDN